MRFFRTGHRRYLKPIGGGVPDWFARIQQARHLGVAPDWFDDKPPIWQDWAAISLAVTNELAEPPQVDVTA